jgi:hypothetical protein
VVVAGLYQIHIQSCTKVLLTTPPLYLAATLLPPGVAALTAGLGVLILQLMTRAKKGSATTDLVAPPVDIADGHHLRRLQAR